MNKYVKKNTKIIILIILVTVILITGITFAFETNDINVSIESGNYGVIYNGETNLPSANLHPIIDSELLSTDNSSKILKITFTVKGAETNPSNIPIIYDVSLTNLNLPVELKSKYLKWRLYKNNFKISEGNFSAEFDAILGNRMVLTNIQQDLPSYSKTEDSYVFYIWLSDSCQNDNIELCTPDLDQSNLTYKTFSGEIRIELSTETKKQLIRQVGKSTSTLDKLTSVTVVSKNEPNFTTMSPTLIYKESQGDSGSSSVDQTTTSYYVTYSSSYEFNEITGLYSLVDPVVAEYSDAYEDIVGKYIVSYELSTSSTLAPYTNLSKIYYVVDASYDGGISIGVIEYNEQQSESDGYNESDIGIFQGEDDLGTTYYYRGNVQNNYVYFAGFWWRIIRINGDGTIRIIYDGTVAHANGESSTDRRVSTTVFNTIKNDNSFVGYMNGTVDGTNFPSGGTTSTSYEEAHANLTDSEAKKVVDNWYKANIVDKGYSSYVADAIYCSDRTPSTDEIWKQIYNATGEGYGSYVTMYGLAGRADISIVNGNPTVDNLHPTFKCEREDDSFTVSKELGNGKLTYPVGLITSDEAVFAGGHMNDNTSFYLYTGNYFWTMSPYSFSSNQGYVFAGRNGSRIFFGNHLTHNNGIRPVISLAYGSIIDGKGTMTNPYVVE